MEVAFEPPALHVAGRHDPRSRRAQLVEVRAQLGVEPLVLEGECRRGPNGLHVLVLLCKGAVVEDRAHPPAFVLDDRGDLSLRRRIDPHRPADGIDVRILVRDPVRELQARVAERFPQSVAQRAAAAAAAAQPGDEHADRLGLAEAEPHESDQERHRKAGDGAEESERKSVGDPAREARLLDDQLRHQEGEREAAAGQDRGVGPLLACGADSPAAVEDGHHRAQERDRDVDLGRADHFGGLGALDEQGVGWTVGAAVLDGIGEQERRQMNHGRVEVGDGDQEAVKPALEPS